jgi:hypothetical protein
VILVDTNQFLIARYSVWVAKPLREGEDVDMSLSARRNFGIRARASLDRMIAVMGRADDEPAFLALESPRTWRAEIFPEYRWSRIQGKASRRGDWTKIHAYLETAIEYMSPRYRPIQVAGAEGDDIIGAAALAFGVYQSTPGAEDIAIVSTDKDFRQLLRFWNVQIFHPETSKWVTTNGDNPARLLLDHILSGDLSDGIPNYLSPSDCFVRGERQRPLRAARREELHAGDPETLLTGVDLKNYCRNRRLIDMTEIPAPIQAEAVRIITDYLIKERTPHGTDNDTLVRRPETGV